MSEVSKHKFPPSGGGSQEVPDPNQSTVAIDFFDSQLYDQDSVMDNFQSMPTVQKNSSELSQVLVSQASSGSSTQPEPLAQNLQRQVLAPVVVSVRSAQDAPLVQNPQPQVPSATPDAVTAAGEMTVPELKKIVNNFVLK